MSLISSSYGIMYTYQVQQREILEREWWIHLQRRFFPNVIHSLPKAAALALLLANRSVPSRAHLLKAEWVFQWPLNTFWDKYLSDFLYLSCMLYKRAIPRTRTSEAKWSSMTKRYGSESWFRCKVAQVEALYYLHTRNQVKPWHPTAFRSICMRVVIDAAMSRPSPSPKSDLNLNPSQSNPALAAQQS